MTKMYRYIVYLNTFNVRKNVIWNFVLYNVSDKNDFKVGNRNLYDHKDQASNMNKKSI